MMAQELREPTLAANLSTKKRKRRKLSTKTSMKKEKNNPLLMNKPKSQKLRKHAARRDYPLERLLRN